MSDVSKTNAELIAEVNLAREQDGGLGALYNANAIDLVDRLADALGSATRVPEQGEANAAIERVRAIHSKELGGTPTGELADICGGCPSYWPCDTIGALDGAPEPEWEYGFELIEPDDRNVFEREGDFISAAFAYRAAKKRIEEEHQADLPRLQYLVVRRRKAGEWLPAEGESE